MGTIIRELGFPPRLDQLRGMVLELLRAKHMEEKLGEHWVERFLIRHPDLKTKFVTGRDKDRVLAQDPTKITHWFTLYDTTVTDYEIENDDIYNMDEKGLLLRVIGKVKVILSKYEKQGYLTQDGSRE